MPGRNCSIYVCPTSRRHKDISIFSLPTVVDGNEVTAKWRSELLRVVTKDREIDANFRQQIEKNKIYICEKHFKEEDLYHCKCIMNISGIEFEIIFKLLYTYL